MRKKYEIWRKEGKLPMQRLAKELIEKGGLPADLDYKSDKAIKLAIKYNDERKRKEWEATKEERRIREEKRKTLPPLETWLGSDKTAKDLMNMGYSYEEILFGEQIEEEQTREEKRKALPPLETWLGKDVSMEELHEMGYSYLEMMELGSRIW